MEEFYTRKKASEGVKFPLTLPDGSKTDHYLIVRSSYSSEYRECFAEQRSKMLDAKFTDQKYIKDDIELLTSLVAGWSFKKEFTHDNVYDFLLECPQIADSIDTTAMQHARFFKQASNNSSNTSKTK